MLFLFYRRGKWDPEKVRDLKEVAGLLRVWIPNLVIRFSSLFHPIPHLSPSLALSLSLSLSILFWALHMGCSGMQPTDVGGGGGGFFESGFSFATKDWSNKHALRGRAVGLVLVLQLHIPKAILTLETCGHDTFYEVDLHCVIESSFKKRDGWCTHVRFTNTGVASLYLQHATWSLCHWLYTWGSCHPVLITHHFKATYESKFKYMIAHIALSRVDNYSLWPKKKD